ncbi:MAG: Gfo/Idh/MocA family oxidoreductase [Planctomycetes bacterium]|nr:Gfo/Idh/MocA family oxidoreductase [Planctomycetota bacterium]
MHEFRQSRRGFLRSSSASLAGMAAAMTVSSPRGATAELPASKNDRLQIGCIGMRYQGTVVAEKARAYGDIVAICDVDRNVREQARASFGSTPQIYEDYRDLLTRNDIDVITIGTPDHWHAKMLIEACRAGKDVYCEKPLTLTVNEGKLIRKVVQETGRVVQVGSWQRSDHRFRQAAEMVRQGRIGRLQRVDIVLGKNLVGGPFRIGDPPPNINWDLWQGQTASVPYIHERCHYTFRWWYEYSGGQMTDWGAHHIDIAQWAIGENPIEVEATSTMPTVENGYNVAIDFEAIYRYPSGVVMTVGDTGRNGILFTGDEGRIFVNRGTLSGKPVEDLAHNPLPRESFRLYDFDNLDRPPRSDKLDSIVNHMGNFFDCIKVRKRPISDVESQHRSVTTCHLGNIAMWVGRPLKWDSQAEHFIDDSEANSRLQRPQRPGFEIS